MATFSSTPKLQAFLAHAGIASRRKSEELIAQGLIMVNGEVAQIGQRVNPAKDVIMYQGELINQTTELYYVLVDKPIHVVSSTQDEMSRQTVLSLLPEELQRQRLYPVGRLDQDSRGLMLMTNDGEVAYHFTHPKFEVPKTYLVKTERPLSEKAFVHLKNGVFLTDGKSVPNSLERPHNSPFVDDDTGSWYEITIHEGRNRQVRRMFERVGYQVKQLIRIKMGPFVLEDLGGEVWRSLTPTEVTQLKQFLKLSSQ